ncbi:hypothetical protein IFM89_018238 [Coptis chinensis]|uniref:cyclin-dependent kinase n=1 Tax=Coptis chinensis TaxID=261450 RepID=A0A835LZS8_9MAGN|nr:hypothetical protein IFM89_018238 [Coptis chinensis]
MTSKSWSIHTRTEITQHYEILERIGSGTYSDVYRGRRLSDNLTVALKEVHDTQSAFREIEALQLLQNSANVVTLYEYFWREDEDAVLVLEYLRSDLSGVIYHGKNNWENGIGLGEVKRWMLQILEGVKDCHDCFVLHRDLKPANLLIRDDGVLKLADFGQARILMEPQFVSGDRAQNEQDTPNTMSPSHQAEIKSEIENTYAEHSGNLEQGASSKMEASFQDGETSCRATCATSDVDDDPLKSSYSYDIGEQKEDGTGSFTSCVGTRYFKAPELLYGSTDYGIEIDLWSLGCIFAELLNLEPLFPGTSDINQLSRIISVLGNITEETWPGCSKLPDYGKIFFDKIENPQGLESCLPNYSSSEICIIRELVCYDPRRRATAMELLQDRYFQEEPLAVALNELRIPSTNSHQGERSPGEWFDYNDMGSDSDFEEFGGKAFDVSTTGTDFSIRFS